MKDKYKSNKVKTRRGEKNYEKKEYRQMAENKKEKNGVSIFGVVISVLMIILATLTITINVCFGAGSSLKFSMI